MGDEMELDLIAAAPGSPVLLDPDVATTTTTTAKTMMPAVRVREAATAKAPAPKPSAPIRARESLMPLEELRRLASEQVPPVEAETMQLLPAAHALLAAVPDEKLDSRSWEQLSQLLCGNLPWLYERLQSGSAQHATEKATRQAMAVLHQLAFLLTGRNVISRALDEAQNPPKASAASAGDAEDPPAPLPDLPMPPTVPPSLVQQINRLASAIECGERAAAAAAEEIETSPVTLHQEPMTDECVLKLAREADEREKQAAMEEEDECPCDEDGITVCGCASCITGTEHSMMGCDPEDCGACPCCKGCTGEEWRKTREKRRLAKDKIDREMAELEKQVSVSAEEKAKQKKKEASDKKKAKAKAKTKKPEETMAAVAAPPQPSSETNGKSDEVAARERFRKQIEAMRDREKGKDGTAAVTDKKKSASAPAPPPAPKTKPSMPPPPPRDPKPKPKAKQAAAVPQLLQQLDDDEESEDDSFVAPEDDDEDGESLGSEDSEDSEEEGSDGGGEALENMELLLEGDADGMFDSSSHPRQQAASSSSGGNKKRLRGSAPRDYYLHNEGDGDDEELADEEQQRELAGIVSEVMDRAYSGKNDKDEEKTRKRYEKAAAQAGVAIEEYLMREVLEDEELLGRWRELRDASDAARGGARASRLASLTSSEWWRSLLINGERAFSRLELPEALQKEMGELTDALRAWIEHVVMDPPLPEAPVSILGKLSRKQRIGRGAELTEPQRELLRRFRALIHVNHAKVESSNRLHRTAARLLAAVRGAMGEKSPLARVLSLLHGGDAVLRVHRPPPEWVYSARRPACCPLGGQAFPLEPGRMLLEVTRLVAVYDRPKLAAVAGAEDAADPHAFTQHKLQPELSLFVHRDVALLLEAFDLASHLTALIADRLARFCQERCHGRTYTDWSLDDPKDGGYLSEAEANLQRFLDEYSSEFAARWLHADRLMGALADALEPAQPQKTKKQKTRKEEEDDESE
jgi:hypothetical protein